MVMVMVITPAAVAQRVMDLIALAVDGAAAEGESRNAALQACRLIARHDLDVVARATVVPYRAPRRTTESEGAIVIKSQFAQPCKRCAGVVEVGERCFWRRGAGVAHFACGEPGAA